MKEPQQFIVNDRGERIAVIVPIEEYEQILEQLEDMDDIRACDAAKAAGESALPLDEALKQIERERK